MVRTPVAAPDTRPERSLRLGGIIGHARAIPEDITFTAVPVTFTFHFFERAEHSAAAWREEGRICSRILAQIKAAIGFVFSIPRI